jgi:DNA-directed RNA polymerase specialized sigma24 family protein
MTARPREKAPGGDRDAAFSRFYRDSVAHLVGRCILLGVPAADAPSVAQGLMLEIYRRWAGIKSAEAYANFAIACRATDYLKLSSRTVAGDDADLARLGRPLTADLPDGVLLIEGEQLVLQALSQLPPVQRAVFALICDDYSIADIAAVLKLKEVTARSHLRHARSTLRTWWSSRTTEDHERGRP